MIAVDSVEGLEFTSTISKGVEVVTPIQVDTSAVYTFLAKTKEVVVRSSIKQLTSGKVGQTQMSRGQTLVSFNNTIKIVPSTVD